MEIFGRMDNVFYPRVVAEEQHSNTTIVYDDNVIEILILSNETWLYASSATFNALSVNSLSPQSEMNAVLKSTFDHFGNRTFLKYQAQGLPQFGPKTTYNGEENDFKSTVQTVFLLNTA